MLKGSIYSEGKDGEKEKMGLTWNRDYFFLWNLLTYNLVRLQPQSSNVHICTWELKYNGKILSFTHFWIALVLGNLDQYFSQVLM